MEVGCCDVVKVAMALTPVTTAVAAVAMAIATVTKAVAAVAMPVQSTDTLLMGGSSFKLHIGTFFSFPPLSPWDLPLIYTCISSVPCSSNHHVGATPDTTHAILAAD